MVEMVHLGIVFVRELGPVYCDENKGDDQKDDSHADYVSVKVADQVGIKGELVDRIVRLGRDVQCFWIRIMTDETGGIRIEEAACLADVDAQFFPDLPEKHLVTEALLIVEEGVGVSDENGAYTGKKSGKRQVPGGHLAVTLLTERIQEKLAQRESRGKRKGNGRAHGNGVGHFRLGAEHFRQIGENVLAVVVIVNGLSGKPRVFGRKSVIAEHGVHETEVHELFFAVDLRVHAFAEAKEA